MSLNTAERRPCVIQITGGKDVGKTVLAERLISELKSRGYSVVAVKISHHDPEPPHKDTHRLRRAGADRVLFYNGDIYVLYTREVSCGDVAADYIVVEGLRDVKIGFKIHVGPDPPSDADVVLQTPNEAVKPMCVEQDVCAVLRLISAYRPRR
ncbi:molybdopterin-guanine dinucleotide biosynthesis protein B [Pyrobaculum neutrophilum]|uniref:Molybdopterin-guanine dinucleotide biosynthesis protein B n=1 Tax=Pyrobaculum neutrophilum (strain DSM 2338 / JCM 9278 / NBRC 100436 / V24Sta) TaxID=444157 RepID=B1YD12_PYRNV|nr:molybdopterin-guanine dinucleotide biosynthesis protein B [Pyrobaculum neutrophilum]ACB39675.1 molybdopterin-guanine dinucleotide biosynthesis protein B [Pyrobaculum neutrophilum V24Sta]